MNHSDVSVIIPAYNAEPWLAAAVASVQAQTFTNWELIIVNDGSTDGTLQVAHTLNDPRIRVVDQVNGGVSAARNAGLAAANGRYICFLDADDAMLPTNLAEKVHALKDSRADWVYADIEVCDSQLQPTGIVLRGTDDDVMHTLLLQASTAVPLSCGNVLALREIFMQGIWFDEHLSNAADQDFTMQLAMKGRSIHLHRVLGLYRMVPGSMSKDVGLYERDHLRLFANADRRGLWSSRWLRKRSYANVHWAIGGSWWLMAKKPLRAIPHLLRAIACWPGVVIRPVRRRIPGLQ